MSHHAPPVDRYPDPSSLARGRVPHSRIPRVRPAGRFLGGTALVIAVLAGMNNALSAQPPAAPATPDVDAALEAATTPAALVGDLERRRATVLDAIGANGVMLLYGLKPAHFSNDVNFEYRQENDLFYLSGIDRPGTALLVSGRAIKDVGHFALFVSIDKTNGFSFSNRRLTADQAAAASGLPVAAIRPPSELADRFRDAIGMKRSKPVITGKRTLYYNHRQQEKMGLRSGRRIREWVTEIRKSRSGRRKIKPAYRIIRPLRVIKSAYEVACLRRAVRATEAGLAAAVNTVRPGKFEYEIEALIEFQYRSRGCPRPAFPSIVGSGRNSCVPHYDLNRDRMQDGDLVVMDVGGEFQHYAADITRTVPVNGKFSPEQRALYELVLRAQREGIEAIKPGVSFVRPHAIATRIIGEGLVQLGYTKKAREYGRYFMHGTSHTLGMDVHDVPARGPLRPGMVLTVEPGIYITEKGTGIRIEDDVLVTQNGYEVLSAGVPKAPDELERLMAAAREPNRGRE